MVVILDYIIIFIRTEKVSDLTLFSLFLGKDHHRDIKIQYKQNSGAIVGQTGASTGTTDCQNAAEAKLHQRQKKNSTENSQFSELVTSAQGTI